MDANKFQFRSDVKNAEKHTQKAYAQMVEDMHKDYKNEMKDQKKNVQKMK